MLVGSLDDALDQVVACALCWLVGWGSSIKLECWTRHSWSYSSGTRYASAVISVSHSPGNSDCSRETNSAHDWWLVDLD